MKLTRRVKESFSVIGKEGSTRQGEGFIQKLWAESNGGFGEVQTLAKTKEDGSLAGIWGAMTDFSRSFAPWEENFTQGLYLAGIECEDGAEAPEGWSKWTLPGFEYLVAEAAGPEAFQEALRYMEGAGLALAGAAQDFTDPADGKSQQWFPIRKL